MTPRGWAIVLGIPAAIDVYAAYVRHDGTLSHTIRELLDTDTTAGRLRLLGLWAGASALLLPHLMIWPADRRR